MNFKKCLRTKSGWSFLEYAIVFAAITTAVVVILQNTMSDRGPIKAAFRDKTDSYIGRIK